MQINSIFDLWPLALMIIAVWGIFRPSTPTCNKESTGGRIGTGLGLGLVIIVVILLITNTI